MSKPRYPLVALSLWLMIGSLAAQTNSYISLGKYRAHPTRILAKYKQTDVLSIQSTAKTLSALGLSVKEHLDLVPGLVVLESAESKIALQSVGVLDPQAQADSLIERIATAENSGLFEYVQPSYVYTNFVVPLDSSFADDTLWGLRNAGDNSGVIGADIDAVRAWDITTGSTNVIVAVIDSGIRYTHRDLATQMWHNPLERANNGLDDDGNGIVDDIFGINAVAGTGDPLDDEGHGTHVAGTIGAAANNGSPMVGVAWQVQLMACKFLDSTGVGLSDDAIRCINYAVKNGAKILNNSWGGGPFERALFDAISAAQKANVLFVAAAGNSAVNMDVNPGYPASYNLNNVISVGASDRADKFAYFSNYGATNVDVIAPGVDIFSTFGDSDTSYQVLAGTSMAAPHVSGVAALILAKFPKATLSELRERIISTAVRVPAFKSRASSEGRVSAYRALTATADGIMELSMYPPPGNDLLAASQVDLFVTITDLKPVTNAVVKATYVVAGVTNTITFLNDGKAPDAVANDGTYSVTFTVPELTGDLELTITATAQGKSDLSEKVVYHLAHRPANDNFEDAAKVPSVGGVLTGTNRFATIQLNEPKHAKVVSVANSIWWNWSPAVSGNAIVDTAGSSFDTVLAVYTNSTLRTLREIASVDDVGPNNSRLQGYLQFDAKAGVTYHIAVAGFNTPEVGSVHLRVEMGGKPDTNAPAVVINSPSSGLVVTNTDGKIVVTGVAMDPQPNASGVKEVFVQVNNALADKASGTTNWASTNLLAQGMNTIRVVAADFAGNRSEARTISVRYQPIGAPNDLFFNALELTGNNGTVTGNNTNATKELGEPFHAGNEGGKSLWWFYRPTQDGVLSLRTVNSAFDTLLAVYTGDRVNALTPIGSNDDAVEGSGFSQLDQAIKAGEVYHVAVDGFAGRSGKVALDYTFTPGAVWHIDCQTPDGGTIVPASGYYPANTNLVFTAQPSPNQEFDHWDGSVNSTDNPLKVVATGDMQLVAHFRDHQVSDGFESGNLSTLPWVTSGNVGWTVQSSTVAAGKFAARSGKIADGQVSSLRLNDLMLPAGTVAFDFKVSSESNWDFLEFYLNGKRLDRWSGEVGWLTVRFDVPAGANTLEWRYVKDPISGSIGSDAAFLDNLELPQAASLTVGTASLQLQRLPDGRVQVSLQGAKDGSYIIQVSKDLVQWETFTQSQAIGKTAVILDGVTAGSENRFYRVITQ